MRIAAPARLEPFLTSFPLPSFHLTHVPHPTSYLTSFSLPSFHLTSPTSPLPSPLAATSALTSATTTAKPRFSGHDSGFAGRAAWRQDGGRAVMGHDRCAPGAHELRREWRRE